MPIKKMSGQLASQLASADLTYEDVGATQAALPLGYHHLRRSRVIGLGPDAYAVAASAVLAWQVHLQRENGIVVFTITAFSQPATAAARAAGPLGHLIQRYITRRYLDALSERRDS